MTTTTKQHITHTGKQTNIYVQIINDKSDNKQIRNYLKQERQEEN
jgi:hypothetical protein